jgi:hypothetical protein
VLGRRYLSTFHLSTPCSYVNDACQGKRGLPVSFERELDGDLQERCRQHRSLVVKQQRRRGTPNTSVPDHLSCSQRDKRRPREWAEREACAVRPTSDDMHMKESRPSLRAPGDPTEVRVGSSCLPQEGLGSRAIGGRHHDDSVPGPIGRSRLWIRGKTGEVQLVSSSGKLSQPRQNEVAGPHRLRDPLAPAHHETRKAEGSEEAKSTEQLLPLWAHRRKRGDQCDRPRLEREPADLWSVNLQTLRTMGGVVGMSRASVKSWVHPDTDLASVDRHDTSSPAEDCGRRRSMRR